jgi:hypothetical protein
MILLPIHPRWALKGLWVVVCAISGVKAGSAVWVLGWPGELAVGVAVAGAVWLVGLAFPPLVVFVHLAWNWAARRITRYGRPALLWICYFVVLLAVGKKNGRFGATGAVPAGSLWMGRETLAPEAYALPFNIITNGATAGGWVRGYVRWAVRSKNLWAIAVLPFLVLIAALEEREDLSLPANVYTLF